MNELLTSPLMLAAIVSTTGMLLRVTVRELRWWLALRGTSPAERVAIIRALRSNREGAGRQCGLVWAEPVAGHRDAHRGRAQRTSG